MGATKRDVSGVFAAELRDAARPAAVLDRSFRLNHHGLTFATAAYFPPWTEVGVRVQLPHAAKPIVCRAVVVRCVRRLRGKGYNISLLFLDLPRPVQAQLDSQPAALRGPLSVAIAR